MTLDQAKIIYRKCSGDKSKRDDYEWETILNEMERIVAAPTPETAASVVEWWGCWYDDGFRGPRNTSINFCRKVRRMWERMNR